MTGKAEVDAVLACLRDLSSREMCDDVSVNFAFVSSKAARKRMVRALGRSVPQAILCSLFCRPIRPTQCRILFRMISSPHDWADLPAGVMCLWVLRGTASLWSSVSNGSLGIDHHVWIQYSNLWRMAEHLSLALRNITAWTSCKVRDFMRKHHSS